MNNLNYSQKFLPFSRFPMISSHFFRPILLRRWIPLDPRWIQAEIYALLAEDGRPSKAPDTAESAYDEAGEASPEPPMPPAPWRKWDESLQMGDFCE